VLADKLSHGSPRLLVECSNCLSAVSDVETLRQIELSRPLLQILQILGSSESELVKHCLGFIGNVASSSRTTVIIQRLIDSGLTGRLLKANTSAGINCTETLINVTLQTGDIKEKCAFEQQKAKLSSTIDHILNIFRRFVDHPKFAQQMRPLISGHSKFNELMRSSTSITVSLALLRLVDIVADEPSLREQWHQDTTFMDIIRFYLAHKQPEFSELARKILSKIEDCDSSMQLADMLDEHYMS
uniref:Armadillo repeat-containing domain-containing protein n=1 Tax=Ascaris lumbricoides TaxID=6252 RepID=A0A9J2PEW8_ASCLU